MKSVLKVLMLLVITQLTVQACAKPTHPAKVVTVEDERTADVSLPIVGDEDTLNINCDKKWGEDSLAALTSYVKYRDYYKLGDFQNAYPLWTFVFVNAPCASEQLLADGHYMFDIFAGQETDVKRKEVLIDSMLLVYAYRLKLYPLNRASTLEKKASSLSRLRPGSNLSDSLAVLSVFEEAYALQNNRLSYYTVSSFFQYYRHAYLAGERSLDDFIKLFFQLSELTSDEIAKNGAYVEYWKSAEQYIFALANDVLTCDMLIPYYKKKYEADPQNLEMIKAAKGMLEAKGCTKDAFYRTLLEKMLEIEPSYEGLLSFAKSLRSEGKYNQAVEYYNKALQMATDVQKVETYYEMAYSALYDQKNCAKARDYARQALAINPNYGNAYIIIGDAYATCISGADELFDNKSAYWAAVDQYNKAKAVDGSVADIANKRIVKYSSMFPTKEKIFFVPDVNEGDSFKVGGWINETTIVRAKPE